MPFNEKSLGNLKSTKNATTFSKDYQPERKGGRKKTKDLHNLIRIFGKSLAPDNLRNDEVIQDFLSSNNLKGTINEVFIARLYALFFYHGSMKAAQLLVNISKNSLGISKNRGSLIINFVAPPSLGHEETIESDSWNAALPLEDRHGDSNSD